jgi:hypothetical protein
MHIAINSRRSRLRMTKKPLPVIGRIQEKLATSTQPGAEARSVQRETAVRSQADWLLERIRKTAAQFTSLAEHGGVVAEAPSASDRDIRRQKALLLGYKLTLTAWRRRAESVDREVVGAIRNRMTRELSDAGSGDSDELIAQRIRKTILDPADSDIAASIIRFEAGLPGPLTPFYGGLAPAFGGPCPTEVLGTRYGKMVRHLYEGVEKKLDERDRGDSAGSGMAQYAGAGT